MRTLILSISLLLFSSSNMLAQLQKHQWKHRLVLIFADEPSQPLYQDQINHLREDASGLKERNIRIYSLFAHSSQPKLSESDLARLKRKYNPNSKPFLCLLIGKDGGVKASKSALYPKQELFDLIDSMPMRRAEMRRKSKGDGKTY